jgi:hypothetical protein
LSCQPAGLLDIGDPSNVVEDGAQFEYEYLVEYQVPLPLGLGNTWVGGSADEVPADATRARVQTTVVHEGKTYRASDFVEVACPGP